MDASLRQRWVDALRSGKYKQGKGTLRNADNEFCCLGVLVDVIDPTRWSAEPCPPVDNNAARNVFTYGDHGIEYESYPPSGHLDFWVQFELGNLNDTKGYTFAQIADYIEHQARWGE